MEHAGPGPDAVVEQARKLDFSLALPFDPAVMVPQERVLACCVENRCGNYGRCHMCPPRIGTLGEAAALLAGFSRGVLLQYSRQLRVAEERAAVIRTKVEFHRLILRLERRLQRRGMTRCLGLIGGNCELCRLCSAAEDGPCRHPAKARPSMEALGIDVLGLLDDLELDGAFHPGRITWTGCVLYGQPSG